MNTKTILGISLAAVFAITITPAFAGISYYDIIDAEVREKTHPNGKDFGLKLEAYTDSAMPQDGSDLLGVGVLTDGWLVVSTSHGGPNGVLDSEVQMDASDPEPHNHYVYLNGDVQCPESPVGDLQLSVADLSWESPGDYKWDDNEIKITGIETGVPTSTIHSGADGEEGAVIAVDTGAISDNVVSFQLAGGPNGQICVIVNDIITASD